jgi:anti-sigma-K factor RskA
MAESETIHELAAAYALDALDERERSVFEAHLAGCAQCWEDVRSFGETAALMAHGVDAASPPPALLERILEQARSERPQQSVVVLRPRRALRLATAAAALAAAAAVALAVWAAGLSSSLDEEREARRADLRAAAILADEASRRLPVGEQSRVVLAPDGEAVLVARGLPDAPIGKTYEAWVIGEQGPLPAALFEGGETEIVLLDEPVPGGAKVAVTLEPEGGSEQPTGQILMGSDPA